MTGTCIEHDHLIWLPKQGEDYPPAFCIRKTNPAYLLTNLLRFKCLIIRTGKLEMLIYCLVDWVPVF